MKTMKDFKGSKGTWTWQSYPKFGDPFFIDDVSKNRETATIHASAGKGEPVNDDQISYEEAQANAKLFANSKNVLRALINLSKQVTKDCSIGSDPKYLEMMEVWQEAQQAINDSL